MKMHLRNRIKSALLLLGCGVVLGAGGNCVPENFWARTWEQSLTTTAETMYATYVLGPLTGALAPVDDE
jgi:hypothetical protein